ncbi:hypothetical protein MJO28_006319 [Puccinia striiformis f. sp. tritici]|uniref:Uncharacterized protein n=1 Tax=Puccinia striiformis f. sp. tritici TaxID=168172 RepID=A0ACC0EIB4_9BASI|nr:hypothetical protein Pst134EB_012480 [Puccinia striiformis f. sp. tritici]KAI7953772.1 hypothetical protein MJO28_006319 [Puccinia striiformis f. sp. tritici]KAI7958069.1 hypothetical protein MJO29_006286 [Puccinia striiformis f. sp. tritici]
MSKRLTIRLSYDIVSPWSYFAYVVLKRYRPLWDFDLILNPVYLGGVMKGSKNTPPFLVPNKLKKMNEEIPLMSKFFGVKCIVPPGPFPFNTLPIMRFLSVVKENDHARLLEAVTDKLYEVIFENQVSVSKDMSEVLKSLSPDPIEAKKLEECLSRSGDEKTKESVKREAERVVEEGGFGFPWLEITQPDGQRLTIFGSDRFEFLANWLGKEWEGPNPSSSNPRESRL